MKKVNQLSDADHKLVTDAVGEAEKSTDGEIVTIVTEQSDKYNDTALIWASLAAFLALGTIALVPGFFAEKLDWILGGWGLEFTAAEYLGIILTLVTLKWLGVWLIMFWKPLRLFLTPKSTKTERVQKRAIDFFKVGAERRTMGLTGILIYVSLKEHRAEIVADVAISEKVSPEVWGDAMVALIDEIRAGRPGNGMAAAVAHVGVVLEEHFPKTDNNPNELPDRLIEL